MKLVSILLRFTRAIREGKWDLSSLRAMFCCVRAFRVFIWLNQVVDLSSFSEMLPYFQLSTTRITPDGASYFLQT